MNHREAVAATLRREPAEFIPGWTFFSTAQAESELLGLAPGDDATGYAIRFAQATNSSIVSVSGNLQGHSLGREGDREIIELDNGTRRLIVWAPEWFYETLWRPLDDADNADAMTLPDVNSYPDYWRTVRVAVERYHQAGLFVRGTLDGFYAGIWEHCRRIDKFLLDLAEQNDFAQRLVDRWGAFVIACADKLLEAGVDALWWTDDLGANTGLIFSPACYRRYFLPWHRRAAELAHSRGAFALMHSHGNINDLLDDLLATGIDLLDPVGPSDGMNLEALQSRLGDHLAFSGGISRFIADMSLDELRAHLEHIYRVAARGGVLPSEEGGVPRNMPPAHFRAYLKMRAELSRGPR